MVLRPLATLAARAAAQNPACGCAQSASGMLAQQAACLPARFAGLSAEAGALRRLLAQPAELTGAQVTRGAVWAAELFGVFCVGEMFMRGSWVGYQVEGDGFPVEHH
eukprot:TRINITY_DN1534_c0_g1_i1.p4 TRINITY_DN1534_c0_g1~~TRINITY_DN1534_c0_g1_i1.p4  ORF type:complete len:107 (+),score=41.37 TRINITY_DN1534_c0_g1_i1:90-410(+)